ncbi:MAG: transketolase [Candidatus Izemoplasmatales bacterium]|jgi:transketolase
MEKTIQNIRFLGLDMIDGAKSGHPGIVLGAAPILYSLYQYHLTSDPKNPDWFNRDRFFLSAGHGSALLYAVLHLAGYDLPLDELKRFRQLGSMTPGHPEYGHTPGVEATTGPLGQGLGMAVGNAIAECHLRHHFNRPGFPVIDHYTYVLCGDGDLQEGVALEALSLAGHLGLERLIIIHDSNDIQLDGPTKNAVSEDLRMKMESMGYYYQLVRDANNVLEVSIAIESAKQVNKPGFIEIKSIIGQGSAKQGTSSVHGSPLGPDETRRLKEEAGFETTLYHVDNVAVADFEKRFGNRGKKAFSKWNKLLKKYHDAYPELHAELENIINRNCGVDIADLYALDPIGHKEATRKTVGKFLPLLSEKIPALMGGSADLASSTNVKGNDGNFSKETPLGRNINFGVREHAMGAIVNGMTLHHLKAFGSGFFVFSDYMKPPIRLAAIMKIPSMFLFTHDSVGVGEDGPTHEPIEQLAMFRSTPGLIVIRPADSNETRHAVRYAVGEAKTPTLIAMTRQDITVMHQARYEDLVKGGYIAKDERDFTGILIASGSEVELALKAQEVLMNRDGIAVRVVSMPSMELFLQQPQAYQDQILPPACQRRLALEMGASGLWYRFSRNVLGIDTFGVSAKLQDVLSYFGFTVENVVKTYLELE